MGRVLGKKAQVQCNQKLKNHKVNGGLTCAQSNKEVKLHREYIIRVHCKQDT